MSSSKSSFLFNSYPYRYSAKYNGTHWEHPDIQELVNKGANAEAALSHEELARLLEQRNSAGDMPLVNYTTQYGMGCFEGLKVFPQKNGNFSFFRIRENGQRLYNSMKGLHMPPFPVDMFVEGVKSIVQKSRELGYYPQYDESWEKDNFKNAKSIYIRPFTYSEGGFGVNLSIYPWVFIVAAEVGTYYETHDIPSIVVSERSRATRNGTGWIKTSSNYVISALSKNEAIANGFTEALFLDAEQHEYVEECSSSNIFFVLQDDTIVTPPLGDTILPGVTRNSVIILAKDQGYKVEERAITIEEVMSGAKECFATGTAVGVNHFGTLVYQGRELVFGDGSMGTVASNLLHTLKFLQYGCSEDMYQWCTPV